MNACCTFFATPRSVEAATTAVGTCLLTSSAKLGPERVTMFSCLTVGSTSSNTPDIVIRELFSIPFETLTIVVEVKSWLRSRSPIGRMNWTGTAATSSSQRETDCSRSLVISILPGILTPGRSVRFSRLAMIAWAWSSRCAQRITWWELELSRTASVVPQLPAPSTVMRIGDSLRGLRVRAAPAPVPILSEEGNMRKPVFSAGQQALDVRAVREDQQQGDPDAEKDQRMIPL